MIHDFVIIKDGLPLLAKNFSDSQKLFTDRDNLVMISGFFSAINSFSDSFENFGMITELKLSNNELKLSFLKDLNIDNLIYLALFDRDSTVKEVQGFLKKISILFSNKYTNEQLNKWNGRMDYFSSFEFIIMQCFKQEKRNSKAQEQNQSFEFLNSFIEEDIKPLETKDEEKKEVIPEYYNYIPNFTSSKKINPKYYLTGETSCKVFDHIDGKRSVNQISKELNVNQNQVYNVCKNLIKFGFISFN